MMNCANGMSSKATPKHLPPQLRHRPSRLIRTRGIAKQRSRLRWLRQTALLVGVLMLTGCFYYPRQVSFYDTDCQIVVRKLVMAETGLGIVTVQCQNEACLLPLIPVAASALIAGSIVVTGNVIFWLEKQGACQPLNSTINH